MTGKITLVGAGPGGTGLMTLRGCEALRRADVVVYDRLVSDEVMELAPENAELLFVGKESGLHSVPQREINQMLVRLAQEGKNVVRLKGGDPYLFGRGGEELEIPSSAGIAFEVVPGVTSAIAAPAFAGIPVTHRDYCSSVLFITGSQKNGMAPDINYDALTKLGGTLVFLMSIAAAPDILRGLRDAGLPPNTPAAFVENGARFNQRKILGTIATLDAADATSPALLVVGETVKLSDKLDWFSKLPLTGKSILVVRPQGKTGKLTSMLRELGANAIPYPCIETQPVENAAARDALRRISDYDWLALTSETGAQALKRLLDELGADARWLAPVKLAAVGAATAEALKALGLKPDFVPKKYAASELKLEGRILALRAVDASPEFDALPGGSLTDLAVYRTVYRAASTSKPLEKAVRRLVRHEIHCVCFTSASTVRGFCESLKNLDLDFSGLKAACIGESSAKAAIAAGFNAAAAANATLAELVETVIKLTSEDDRNTWV